MIDPKDHPLAQATMNGEDFLDDINAYFEGPDEPSPEDPIVVLISARNFGAAWLAAEDRDGPMPYLAFLERYVWPTS